MDLVAARLVLPELNGTSAAPADRCTVNTASVTGKHCHPRPHLTAFDHSAITVAVVALIAACSAAPAAAQDTATAVPRDAAFIFNTLLFIIGGFLVMWMAAGFAMLEAGMVRTKNVAMQCTKNIALFAISGIMFWLVGYNLMYPGDGNWIIPDLLGNIAAYPTQPVGAGAEQGNYSVASDWFFQMMFCAATASIVSGTIAERVKLWPFLIFVAILTGVIYPIQGSWEWGTGFLDDLGFSDFAGSTLVHSTGGWAALSGALFIGARAGKYSAGGRVNPMPGSSMPLATLGTFILWLGWFGFNGGSQLAMGTIGDVSDVSRIFVNTNMAAAAGVVVALVLTQLMYGKVDLTMALNGALAGLVAITAEPLQPSVPLAMLIGGFGGAIVVVAVPLLDRFRIDDVVGAIPVHLLAGIWGTMVVPLSNAQASFGAQFIGVLSVGVFVFVVSSILWWVLKMTVGLRPSAEDEAVGLDLAEIGVEAYPEFGSGRQRI